MLNLTDLAIRSFPTPEKGQKDYFDGTVAGFGVRVSAGGTRSFFLLMGRGASRRRITIGRVGIVKLADARAKAKRLLAERTLGQDRPKSVTFSEALKVFEQQKYPALKDRTVHDYKAIFRRHFTKKLGDLRLSDIEFETVTDITDKLVRKKSEQRHALVVLGTFFRWCVRRRLLKHNALEGVDIPKAGKRSRVLSDAELVSVYRGAEGMGYPFGAIVRLLILTGQRRGEIAALRDIWLGDEGIVFPPGFAKNKQEHAVPVGPMAQALLDEVEKEGLLFPAVGGKGKPFSGFSKCKKALDTTLENVKPYTLHDLRRTFSTNVAKLGVLPHVKEALLNHVSAKSEVEAIYDRYSYLPEKRAALERWEAHVCALLERFPTQKSAIHTGAMDHAQLMVSSSVANRA